MKSSAHNPGTSQDSRLFGIPKPTVSTQTGAAAKKSTTARAAMSSLADLLERPRESFFPIGARSGANAASHSVPSYGQKHGTGLTLKHHSIDFPVARKQDCFNYPKLRPINLSETRSNVPKNSFSRFRCDNHLGKGQQPRNSVAEPVQVEYRKAVASPGNNNLVQSTFPTSGTSDSRELRFTESAAQKVVLEPRTGQVLHSPRLDNELLRLATLASPSVPHPRDEEIRENMENGRYNLRPLRFMEGNRPYTTSNDLRLRSLKDLQALSHLNGKSAESLLHSPTNRTNLETPVVYLPITPFIALKLEWNHVLCAVLHKCALATGNRLDPERTEVFARNLLHGSGIPRTAPTDQDVQAMEKAAMHSISMGVSSENRILISSLSRIIVNLRMLGESKSDAKDVTITFYRY